MGGTIRSARVSSLVAVGLLSLLLLWSLLDFALEGYAVTTEKIGSEGGRRHAEPLEMRVQGLAVAALPLAAGAVNVVVSNDDGWAVSNLRAFYNALLDAGYDAIVSAPAVNQSGRGSLDGEPEEVDDGCQFQSCPPGSPPKGSNASDPRLNYVNSYPVTAMAYGIEELSPDLFDSGVPDVAVAGPNHGSNIDAVTLISGTVGAAVEAASQGIPALAFSGATGDPVPWNEPTPQYSQVYADLALIVTQALTSGPKPYLPDDTWLNVNFPEVNDECSQPSDFKFVLSRIYSSIPIVTPPDVDTCGLGGRLRSEKTVAWTDGCYASISVADLDKTDGDREKQAAVLERLEGILSCLP